MREIVRCGLAAPSSKNSQPWRGVAACGYSTRRCLAAMANAVEQAEGADEYVPHNPATGQPRPAYVSTVRESAQVLRDVSAAIFMENRGLFSNGRSALASATRPALAGSLVGFGLEMVGIGTAIENMWLAAEALGVRVAFMGDVAIAEDEICRRLHIAGDLVGVLALGFSDVPPPARRQRSTSRTQTTWCGTSRKPIPASATPGARLICSGGLQDLVRDEIKAAFPHSLEGEQETRLLVHEPGDEVGSRAAVESAPAIETISFAGGALGAFAVACLGNRRHP